MFCNAQLYNIPQSASKPVYVWMKASYQTDPDLEDPLKMMKEKGMKILFSDSAYYSIDSSERSKVYLFKNNALQSTDYLKSLNAESMPKYFGSGTQLGQILAKKVLKVSSDKSNLYLLDDYRRLLIVSKENLSSVLSSIEVNDSEVRHLYTQALTKARGNDHFLQYQDVLQRAHLPKKVSIRDFSLANDTVFFAMSTVFADSSQRKGIYASNKPFISVFVKGKLVAVYAIDGIRKDPATHTSLTVDASNMVYRRGKFLLSINADTLTENAPMLGITQAVNGAMKLSGLAKYYLPQHLVATHIGYMMSGILSSHRFVSNTYSSTVYDIENDRAIELDFPHDSNVFTHAQVSSLRFKVNFQVLGLYDDKDKLTLLTKNDDAVECIRYKLAKDKLSFVSRSSVTGVDSRYASSNWMACDQDGFYVFNKDERRIEYIAYR